MTTSLNLAITYASKHHEDFLSDLKQLVSIPSVSTSPEHSSDIERASKEVCRQLKQVGMDNVTIYPTPGHPAVYADWLHAPGKPTILVYGHYDVQPPDPLDLWESGPYTPTIRGHYLFGRGASDMKGQVVAVLSALRSIYEIEQKYPVNLKFIIEGEEEIGSPNLRSFIESHRDLLACDISLNTDAGMIAPDVPTIVYSLRGLAFFELKFFGPDHDLHSGVFGGVVHNPAVALCDFIAGLHDANGTVTIPGFYDRVRSLTDIERMELARLPMTEASFMQQTGVSELWGEKEFTPVERVGARPTLEVNGLLSGFTGSGTKTVLPAYSMAKISCRLVADQEPEEIHQLFRNYLERTIPSTIRWELIYFGGAPASATDPFQPAAQAMNSALEKVWGVKPVLKREGGSVPVVGDIQKALGVDSVLIGFGLPDDRIHSPNERLHLPTWFKGIEALTHFFFNMGEFER